MGSYKKTNSKITILFTFPFTECQRNLNILETWLSWARNNLSVNAW